MSFRSTIFAVLATVAVPLAANAASPQDDVTAAYAAWDAAFATGDAKAIAAFYTDDATFLPPTHDVIEGPAGVEKFFAGLLGNGVTGHKLELIEVEGDGHGRPGRRGRQVVGQRQGCERGGDHIRRRRDARVREAA